jgi:signal transduction histidine kinase
MSIQTNHWKWLKWPRYLLRIRTLLVLLILGTILGLCLHPLWLFEGKKVFNTTYVRLSPHTMIAPMPKESGFDYVTLGSEYNTFKAHYRKLDNSHFSEKEMPGYSSNPSVHGNHGAMFVDGRHIWAVLTMNNADYYLMDFADPNATPTKFLFHDDYWDALHAPTITVAGTTFLPWKSDSTRTTLTHLSGGVCVTLALPALHALYATPVERMETDSLLVRTAGELAQALGRPFTVPDLYEMVFHFARQHYFQKKFLCHPDYQGFTMASVYDTLTSATGRKQVLVYQAAERFMAGHLYCVDVETGHIAWTRAFATGIWQMKLIRLNNRPVIVTSCYSTCSENPPEWFRQRGMGVSYRADIKLLDSNGAILEIAGKPAVVSAPMGFYCRYFQSVAGGNALLLGMYQPNNTAPRSLQRWDLSTNTVTDLPIATHNVSGVFTEGSSYAVLDSRPPLLQKIVLDASLREIRRDKLEVTVDMGAFQDCIATVDGIKVYILAPFTLLDKRFRELYTCPYNIDANSALWMGNTLLFREPQPDGTANIGALTFERNHALNPWAILVLIGEFLLVLLYVFMRHLARLPLDEEQKSYLVLYSLAGCLHFWKAFGTFTKYGKLPKSFSTRRADFARVLEGIAPRNRLTAKRRFLILTYEVYVFDSPDELLIIQRGIHDLKHRMFGQRDALARQVFTLAQYDLKPEDREELRRIADAQRDIADATTRLNQLSFINAPARERRDLLDIVEKILGTFLYHEKFPNIRFENRTTKSTVSGDPFFLETAIGNLLKNALDSGFESGHILVTLAETSNDIRVVISNPGDIPKEKLRRLLEPGETPRETTKTTSTGVGLPLARVIAEKHGGHLELTSVNGIVKATLILPRATEQKEGVA